MKEIDKVALDSIEPREIVPGYKARFIHSANMTFAYWDIKAGAPLQQHSHVHEQVVNMLEGEFELVLDGKPIRLIAGDTLVIPSNVPHSGIGITDCKILDVFYPVRQEYVL